LRFIARGEQILLLQSAVRSGREEHDLHFDGYRVRQPRHWGSISFSYRGVRKEVIQVPSRQRFAEIKNRGMAFTPTTCSSIFLLTSFDAGTRAVVRVSALKYTLTDFQALPQQGWSAGTH